jgi:hypothetical protein
MIKRVTWFAGGVVVGLAGAGMAKRKVKEVAAQASPVRVARTAFGRVGEAVGEGRRAARGREAELRARYDGVEPVALADELDPDAAVLIDGELVDAGKVIVLRPATRETRRRRRA